MFHYVHHTPDGTPIALLANHGALDGGTIRIDPFEELHWAEFSARMRYRHRRVLASGAGSPGVILLAAGTAGGAWSLGIAAGNLEPGQWADIAAVDLDHPSLHDSGAGDLRDVLIFGAGAAVVTDVWVGGTRMLPYAETRP